MTIKIRELKQAAKRSGSVAITKSFNEASDKKLKTAFLCHSHLDQELAKGLQIFLKEQGLDLYIDWEDSTMPSEPNKVTADQIKNKINESDLFFFLATNNSTRSRWCPWEIGVADQLKGYENIIIVPTMEDNGSWYGNEYLQLYKRLDEGTHQLTGLDMYGVFEAGTDKGKWIKYI